MGWFKKGKYRVLILSQHATEKNATPDKPAEGSSMPVAESEDLSFRTSKLEELVKGFLKKGDLDDLKGELMKELKKEWKGQWKH